MRDVAIVGVGMNKWGELWEKSLADLIAEGMHKRHQLKRRTNP